MRLLYQRGFKTLYLENLPKEAESMVHQYLSTASEMSPQLQLLASSLGMTQILVAAKEAGVAVKCVDSCFASSKTLGEKQLPDDSASASTRIASLNAAALAEIEGDVNSGGKFFGLFGVDHVPGLTSMLKECKSVFMSDYRGTRELKLDPLDVLVGESRGFTLASHDKKSDLLNGPARHKMRSIECDFYVVSKTPSQMALYSEDEFIGSSAGVTPHKNHLFLASPEVLFRACESNDIPTLDEQLKTDRRILEEKDQNGNTPLIHAIINNRAEAASRLISAKADVNARGKGQATPLMVAITTKNVPMVDILLRYKADVNMKDEQGCCPLTFASRDGMYGIVENLLRKPGIDINSQDRWQATPLIHAIITGNDHIAALLLDDGADANIKDVNGRSPLTLAVLGGKHDIVQKLLQKPGIEINSRDQGQGSPLIHAVTTGDANMVALLLNHGADANIKDVNGCSPLTLAVLGGKHDIVQTLLQKGGIDINSRDQGQATPLIHAVTTGDANMVHLLLMGGANANLMDAKGWSPLTIASFYGKDIIVELLLRKPDINVNITDAEGCSPLALASRNGKLETVNKLLRKPGINLNSRDLNGVTPLQSAIYYNQVAVAEFLLRCGANADVQNNQGISALQIGLSGLVYKEMKQLMNEYVEARHRLYRRQ